MYFNESLSTLPVGSEGKVIKVTNTEQNMVMVDFNGTRGVLKRSQVGHERSVAVLHTVLACASREVDSREACRMSLGDTDRFIPRTTGRTANDVCACAGVECEGKSCGGGSRQERHQNPISDPCAQGKGQPVLR